MCGESTDTSKDRSWVPLGVTALALWVIGTLSCVLAFNSSNHDRAAIKHDREEAIQLKARGLAAFDKLDTDHDGLLFEEELRNDVLDSALTGEDLAVARELYEHCKDIGHSIGNYRSGKFTIAVYAISKADLKLLPANTEKRLRERFGSLVDR